MSCTDSPALPIIDTMFAVGSAIAIGAVARRESECTGEHCGVGALVAIPFIPVVLVTLPSALWGYGTVSRCRAYKRSNAQEARVVEELEVEVRRLAAEGKCTELKAVWDELLAREQELNFEHNIEYMVISKCADQLGVEKPPALR